MYKRGQLGAGGIIAAGLGMMILFIVMFSVVLPVSNQVMFGSNVTQASTNLTGGSLSLALQTPLLLVLGLIFIPIVSVALGYFSKN